MFAVAPGGPDTSYTTTFGLNYTISMPAPAFALRSCEPKILCSRITTSPETPSTTINSRGIHARLNARVTAPVVEPGLVITYRLPLTADGACRPAGKLAIVVDNFSCPRNLCSAKYAKP